MDMNIEDLQTVLPYVRQLAESAGTLQMEYLNSAVKMENKSSQVDIVTEVDQRCEELITSNLHTKFPDHEILGEEQGSQSSSNNSPYRWVIDPLDGTTNYVHRVPVFATSIALLKHDRPVLGVVHSAPLGRTYTAIAGEGAYLTRTPLHTSKTSRLNASLVATGVPYDRATTEKNNVNYIAHLTPRVRGIRRMGAAALDICFVAEGVFDAYWELKVRLWDIAAGILIAREAGAVVNYLSIDNNYSYDIICSAPGLYKPLLTELQSVAGDFDSLQPE